MRIAIIGWGSLIWDIDNLAPHVRGPWGLGAGPTLPFEFSHVSVEKRLGALTVVIDATRGDACATSVIESGRADIVAAAEDLSARERAPMPFIGYWSRGGPSQSAASDTVDRVAAWADAGGWDGAVWTDLAPTFERHTGAAFTLPAAERYLQGLSGASRDEAVRYITNAPETTDTPLRRHLEAASWWTDEVARLRAAAAL